MDPPKAEPTTDIKNEPTSDQVASSTPATANSTPSKDAPTKTEAPQNGQEPMNAQSLQAAAFAYAQIAQQLQAQAHQAHHAHVQAQVNAQNQTQATHSQAMQGQSSPQADLHGNVQTQQQQQVPQSQAAHMASMAQTTPHPQLPIQLQLGMNPYNGTQQQSSVSMSMSTSHLPQHSPNTPHTPHTPSDKASSSSKRKSADAGAQPFYYPDGSCTRCPCNENQRDDGVMIQCEQCDVWQHAECLGMSETAIPDQYYCELCKPEDPLHVHRASHAPNGCFYPRRPLKPKKPRGKVGGKSGGKRRRDADYDDETTELRVSVSGSNHTHHAGAHAGASAGMSQQQLQHQHSGQHVHQHQQHGQGHGLGLVASPTAADSGLDDASLTREDRKLKRSLEMAERTEQRHRRHDQASVEMILEDDMGMDDEMDGSSRLARIRQRAKVKAVEDTLPVDEEEEVEEIVMMGPDRAIHSKAWVKRPLVNRGAGYLPLKHWFMKEAKVMDGAGPLAGLAVNSGSISKRILLSYSEHST